MAQIILALLSLIYEFTYLFYNHIPFISISKIYGKTMIIHFRKKLNYVMRS